MGGSDFLKTLAEEPILLEGVALDETGTLRSPVPVTPVTALGEESAGFRAEMEVMTLDSSFLIYGALWRRGSAVLVIYLIGAPGMDHSESVWRLAADGRKGGRRWRGTTAVPLAPLAEDATRRHTNGDDLELQALDQGYDLRALTDLGHLLPGFEVTNESFSTDGSEIGFKRDYEPESFSAPVGDSTVMTIGTEFDLLQTEFEAAATMSIIGAMEPDTWPTLFAVRHGTAMGTDREGSMGPRTGVPLKA